MSAVLFCVQGLLPPAGTAGDAAPPLHPRLSPASTAAMGKLLSKIFGNKEMRILMLGLDAAGKTSILFHHQTRNNITRLEGTC